MNVIQRVLNRHKVRQFSPRTDCFAVNQLGDGSADGVLVGVSGAKVGFYGATPVVARPELSSLHLTAYVSVSSASPTSTTYAWYTEVTNTLVALGIWVT